MREVIKLDTTTVEQQNRSIRDERASRIDSLEVSPPKEPVKETRARFNSINLPSANIPTFDLKKPFTTLRGNNTRTDVDRTCNVEADAKIRGMSFFSKNAIASEPVARVRAGARAVFQACVFNRKETSSDTPMIEVEEGAEAIFIGCTFIGGGLVVNNLGGAPAAASVKMIACSSRDTGLYGDVTDIGSL
jgi:hypothetical protein